jgi:dihydroorotate dehydrogenase electron transfer subunit
MKIAQIKSRITANQKAGENYWHLEFESSLIAKQARPGQFVNIRVNAGFEPLLRRPLSIHGVGAAKVKVIYEVVGRGTQMLAKKLPGEFLDIIGPLGNGFDYPPQAKSLPAKYILIAGGMGVAPLVFLAQKLNKPLVLIGARSKSKLICQREFKSLGCLVKVATDDGSSGFKGKVTDLLRVVLDGVKPRGLFSCGPQVMLKTVAQIARENKISSQLSLEEHMACGLGACLGCVVQTKHGYKSVCKDGPVFSGEELVW